jgi:transcriptional regulator with XRE-family HTH domain
MRALSTPTAFQKSPSFTPVGGSSHFCNEDCSGASPHPTLADARATFSHEWEKESPELSRALKFKRETCEALLRAAEDAADDAADVAMFDARVAQMQGDSDARLPVEVSALLLRVLTRVKALRKWRGLKQREVAKRSGIAQGFSSEIESGKRAGSRKTLERIAQALDAPLAWLVSRFASAEPPGDRRTAVRTAARTRRTATGAGTGSPRRSPCRRRARLRRRA